MSNTSTPPIAPSLATLENTQPHTFIIPVKNINEGHDVPVFLTSKAYGDVMTFLLQLNRAMFPSSIKNPISEKVDTQIWELGSSENLHVSENVTQLIELFNKLDVIIDEVPPDPGPRRFGNASFRKWYEIVESRMDNMLSTHLPTNVLSFSHTTPTTSLQEFSSYLLGSFGSAQRLDYGSGHELSFLAFLGCIWKLGGFQSQSTSPSPEPAPSPPPGNTERAIVLHLISRYLSLIRRLIKTYTLEPAGSHGVWGLDDHSFIPYIFGSAQYGPPVSAPDQITPTEGSRADAPEPGDVARIAAVERERNKNLYFGAIGFIHDVKKGPFWEHSPMLYDISGVSAGWGKINKVCSFHRPLSSFHCPLLPPPTPPSSNPPSLPIPNPSNPTHLQGMIKMYSAEVLSKFPVVQHFHFGSLFPWSQDPTAPPPQTSAHTSNQPIRDGPTGALENASARGKGQEGIKAPWANKAPNMTPTLGAGTAAPWAGNRAPMTANTLAPSPRIPQSTTSRAPLPTRTQRPPPPGTDTPNSGSSMPPPTRAPWAKPP